MTTATVVTFIAHFVLLLGMGWHVYRRNESIEEYLLGGRQMGAWVTALSAQASDMSGWLSMGLPGAIHLCHWGSPGPCARVPAMCPLSGR